MDYILKGWMFIPTLREYPIQDALYQQKEVTHQVHEWSQLQLSEHQLQVSAE